MGIKFNKPSLSISDQIALLEARGLLVGDHRLAEHCLQYISYYRLRAYCIYFEKDPLPSVHGFAQGTTFEQVLSLYNFDRLLRLTMLDAIERVEIAARGSWAHHLAMTYGPHGYLQARIYKNRTLYARNRGSLEQEVRRSRDDFIEHYNLQHGDPKLPPVWMVSEIMSLGQLSKWQTALQKRADVVSIAKPFDIDYKVYLAFTHHLATVRNICAHHGRIWNKRFTVTMTLPARAGDLADAMNDATPRQLYNTLTMLLFMINRIAPDSGWKAKLLEVLLQNPTKDFAAMGFPADWQKRPVWK